MGVSEGEGMGGNSCLGMAEPQLGPCSQVMEAYREKCSNLPRVKMAAMVVTGEFLVSVAKA